ncbi:MAG: ATP-dependent DNA helicase RecG, partial [Christensenellales bacterium]
MNKATEKLSRIFKLEAQQGFENRAVMGGLVRLTQTWESDAREVAMEEKTIQFVSQKFGSYAQLSPIERKNTLIEIAEKLAIQETLNLPAFAVSDAMPDLSQTVNEEDERQTASVNARSHLLKSISASETTSKSTGISASSQRARAKSPVSAARPTHQAGDSSSVAIGQSGPKTAGAKTAGVKSPPAPRFGIEAPVTVIRGVGDKQAENLSRLGVYKIKDLLNLFPRRYDDYSKLKTINMLYVGDEVTIIAKVLSSTMYQISRGRKIVEVIVSDTTGNLRLMWFNQQWILKTLREGMFISISGKVENYMGRMVIMHPEFEALDKQQLNTNRIVPVYPLTANVTQKWLRRLQFNTVNYWSPKIHEFMPAKVQEKAKLIPLPEAYTQIHFPDDEKSLKSAQNRFAFDEIFLIQLGVIQQKKYWQTLTGRAWTVSDSWLNERLAGLPFELTGAQMRTVNEIRGDLAQTHPMNRLLQGDVGSGKTVVAMLAMAMVIEGGAQAAIMAPTSILAEQHYRTLSRLMTTTTDGKQPFLEADQVRLLTGDTSAAERAEIHADLQSGHLKVLIGTHALIEDPVQFQDLQLVVIDEQHRFGVNQRAKLRAKGDNPHVLVMTATPIPRSLQLTIFGDLDVSVIDEMPAGRLPVHTMVAFPSERERVYNNIRAQVKQGNQAFIIYPLVEASENEEIKAAVDEQKRLQKEVFPDLKVGLVHGRLKPAEKDEVMLKFRDREFDILVSTSVVEVGVDIPNATMMVIEGANRFGLAQLHQFRGRVGRGDAQSYCFLIPQSSDDSENERLNVMTRTNDGFLLAEEDLKQRGPGDFLGTKQAGYIELKMAN